MMSTLVASLAFALQSAKPAKSSGFSMKMILGSMPHDPASIVALVLCVVAVAAVLWAGHRKPKDGPAEGE